MHPFCLFCFALSLALIRSQEIIQDVTAGGGGGVGLNASLQADQPPARLSPDAWLSPAQRLATQSTQPRALPPLTPAQARPRDLYYDVEHVHAFYRACPDCFQHVTTQCPVSEAGLDLKTWAGELADSLTRGCQPSPAQDGDCSGRCCSKADGAVAVVVKQMAQMMKDYYHVLLETCDGCSVGPRPGQDVRYGDWGPFCACDCATGREIRDRKCYVDGQPASPHFCLGLGPARESRACDVRLTCPACVSGCAGARDGVYPACSSCADYVDCKAGRGHRYHCGRGTSFDAFVGRCAPGPSPSCTLADVPSGCRGLESGKYPLLKKCCSYLSCNQGQEFQVKCRQDGWEYNHHSRECEAERSPTCVRPLFDQVEEDELHSASGKGYPVHHADAPPSMYYSGRLDARQRRDMHALGLDEQAYSDMAAAMTTEALEHAVSQAERRKEGL